MSLQGRDWRAADIKAVLFDLDNTLTHRAQSIERYVARFLQDFQSRLKTVDPKSLFALISATDNGGYGRAGNPHPSIKASIAHRLHRELAWRSPPSEAALLDHWFHSFPTCAVLMPGALEILTELRKQNLPVAILSNGNDLSRQATVDALGLREFCVDVFSSDRLRLKKPDPATFRHVAEVLGIAPEACLMVGDHPTVDVCGAQSAGLSAVWLRGFHNWPEIHPMPISIDTLSQLTAWFRHRKN
ncbi:HAD family hydrolase [Reinekea blandensis]|uniref:HAD family hydrolase n=1 Tax=Reinekea blandensis TaxID=374838 RepID=UPI00030D7FD6|nr:HAD family hydrolase [Reinekea blandensis]